MATLPVTAPRHTRVTPAVAKTWTWCTLAALIVVVLEGAVVRATGSGGGCGNHWPLCNGEFLPHHPRLATIIEFTHRSLTGLSSACVLVMLGATFASTRKRHPARRAAVAATLFLVGEALLGAVLVKFGLVENNTSTFRVVMQSVHFTNTLLLLGATTLVAVLLGKPVSLSRVAAPPRLLWLALAATILTGATGSLAALADTIFPSPDLRTALSADFAQGSPLLIRMRWMHPAAALLASVAVVALVLSMRRHGARSSAIWLSWNLVAQLGIGLLDVVWLAPVTLQVLHLLSADLFWISLVMLAGRAFWFSDARDSNFA